MIFSLLPLVASLVHLAVKRYTGIPHLHNCLPCELYLISYIFKIRLQWHWTCESLGCCRRVITWRVHATLHLPYGFIWDSVAKKVCLSAAFNEAPICLIDGNPVITVASIRKSKHSILWNRKCNRSEVLLAGLPEEMWRSALDCGSEIRRGKLAAAW